MVWLTVDFELNGFVSIDCSFSIISGIAVAELNYGKNGVLDKQSHESDCVHCKFGTVIVLNTYRVKWGSYQ